MKKSTYIILLVFIAACSTSRVANNSPANPGIQPYIDATVQQYAPDKRTALFKVITKGNVLSGETNLAEAKTALLQKLRDANINFIDSIQILPDQNLQGKQSAVVSVSVANLRLLPGHPAELVTQATLGTPLKVLKRERGWYFVQTPDKYLAWVEGGMLAFMDPHTFKKWEQSEKLIYTQPFGLAYASPDAQAATVSDLVYGDVLTTLNERNGFYEVSFPDGRIAFVPVKDAMKYKEWALSRQPTEENLVRSAKQLLGVPYLWGGTSFKGVDCSGFTKTVYFMNGLVLPRDASQQVNIGEEIDTKNGWGNLRPGDLLFFGISAKDNRPERVVHVGMWIGNDEFIQAASMVKISSFNTKVANYDSSEHRRFLRAKRIQSHAAIYDLRKPALY